MSAFDSALKRAFHAANGEVGVLPEDAAAYLDACQDLGIEVLGWELWLIDHEGADASPATRPGAWTGAIPARGADTPCAIGGEGDIAECRDQIASMDFDGLVEEKWRPFLRINFTLDA